MDRNWIESGASESGFVWKGIPHNPSLEAVHGPPNFKQIWWLEEAVIASRKVARVNMPGGTASGFMIADDIFMTNNHVFGSEDEAAGATLQFDYRYLTNGDDAPVDEWECDPYEMFKTNEDLDYAIVRVKKKGGKTPGETRGFFDLRHELVPAVDDRVNLIQHPQGRRQEIAFRDNQVKAVEDAFIQYMTDTDYGTSGSPVLDDMFRCVALHNQRVEDPDNPNVWYRNQGYRVDVILEDAGNLIP